MLLMEVIGRWRALEPLAAIHPPIAFAHGFAPTCKASSSNARDSLGRIADYMWKIERLTDGDRVVLKVSGRMQGEQLAELEKTFAEEAGTRRVVVDLKDVRLADQDTVRFLAAYEAQGIQLLNCPSYLREWISRVRPGNGNALAETNP